MKTELKLSVSISLEEAKILQQAYSILESICFTFNNHGECKICPMHAICNEKLNGVSTPHGILYHVQNVLDVKEEKE